MLRFRTAKVLCSTTLYDEVVLRQEENTFHYTCRGVNVGFTIPVMKDTTVSFKLDRALKARLVALAKSENRSLSNFIEKVLKEEIVRHESKQARGKSG